VGVLRVQKGGPYRGWWAVTATSLFLLFVVEVSPAHVHVDRLAWGKLLYLPLLVCLAASLARLAHGSGHGRIMWVALAALAASYTVHIFGPHVVAAFGWGTDSLAFQAKVGLKEGAELAGWLLMVVALWRIGQRPSSVDRRTLAVRVRSNRLRAIDRRT
jgi:hypothetical protein